MNKALVKTLNKIHSLPDRPHSTCPGYEHWLGIKIWEAAIEHYIAMSGPKSPEVILNAAGVCCCGQDGQGSI